MVLLLKRCNSCGLLHVIRCPTVLQQKEGFVTLKKFNKHRAGMQEQMSLRGLVQNHLKDVLF